MLIIFAPMIALLFFIIVASSEMALTEAARSNQSSVSTPLGILKKTIQDTTDHIKELEATIYPTLVRKYSKYRNSVNRVRAKEIIRKSVLKLKPIFTELDIELLYDE